MPLNLFIDTNILLSFYHFSREDLDELKKLVALVETRHVALFITPHLVDEYKRNRDAKIMDGLNGLIDPKLPKEFPQICTSYDDYAHVRNLQKQYSKAHAALLDLVLRDARTFNLNADHLIGDLLSKGTRLPVDNKIYIRARERFDVGNPPGKGRSMGDALNWEYLLEAVPLGETLHFITDDKDYSSPLEKSDFNSFLLEEWARTKESSLISYGRISAFFASEQPQIKLASELEKELLIQELSGSNNFQQTHITVAKLKRFRDFTVDQANAILAAAVSNSQVNWIAQDSDVREMLDLVVKSNSGLLDEDMLQQVLAMISSGEEQDSGSF